MSKKTLILTAMDPVRDIRANKVAKSLTKFGYEVKIIGGYTPPDMSKTISYSIESFQNRYNTQDMLYKKLMWKLHFFTYIKSIYKNYRPDIIHCANVDMLLIGLILGRRRCKLVYDSYEINSQKSGVASKSKLISKIIELIERFLIKYTESMIVVSQSAKEYFINKYDVRNIYVITNVPNKPDVYSVFKAQEFNALYIGSYTTNRGIEEFILSGKYLKKYNINLLLQGFGPHEDELKNLVEKNNLTNKVQFLKPVDPQNMICEIRKNAMIGVVLTKPTSLNHKLTVSNKLFDYINAQIPVIMSNVDEHNLINNKYNIGIIVKNIDPKTIAESIVELYKDQIYYAKLKTNAVNAAKVLNWEIEEIKLKSIYDKLGDLNET